MTPGEIRALRLSHGLTQKRAAELIHYSIASYQSLEQADKSLPSARDASPVVCELLRLKYAALDAGLAPDVESIARKIAS